MQREDIHCSFLKAKSITKYFRETITNVWTDMYVGNTHRRSICSNVNIEKYRMKERASKFKKDTL